jgi:hypothetical protein
VPWPSNPFRSCFQPSMFSKSTPWTQALHSSVFFDYLFWWPPHYRPSPAPPCNTEDIPEIDAIIISVRVDNWVYIPGLSYLTMTFFSIIITTSTLRMNLFASVLPDVPCSLDTATIGTLFQRSRKPHIFAPLGNGPFFRHLGIAETYVHIMDWWESKHVQVDIPSATDVDTTHKAHFDVTCTPSQHFGLFDHFKTLWASWIVHEVAGETTLDAPTSTSGCSAEGVVHLRYPVIRHQIHMDDVVRRTRNTPLRR